MLVRAGLLPSGFSWGQILAPSCGQIKAVYTKEVPLTTKEGVNILGGDFGIDSNTDSGCPTNVYGCNSTSTSASNCPPANQIPWKRGTIKDLQIDPLHLRQAWTDLNARCYRNFFHTAGSQCQVAMVAADGNLYYQAFPLIGAQVCQGKIESREIVLAEKNI